MGRKRRRTRGRKVAHSSCVIVNPPSQTVTQSPTEEVYDGLLYAGESHNCVKIPATKPILMIDSETFGILRCLADKYPNSEWGVYLIGEVDKDGDGICSSHLIPKQHATSGSVLPDSNVDNVVCWLHSHHGMGAWHSGTDRQYANYPFIATVSLQQGKFDISAKKRFVVPCCNKYILIDTDVQFYFADAEEETVAETNILHQAQLPAVSAIPTAAAVDAFDDDWHQRMFGGDGVHNVYHGTNVPSDPERYHPVGTKCELGLEEDGCKWACHFATRNYYKNGKQHIYCDKERAQARVNHPVSQQGWPHGLPQPMGARESETERKRWDKHPDRNFAAATKNKEALSIVAIGGTEIVAVDEGTACPAKGINCYISCPDAVSCRPVRTGERVVLCSRKAKERRNAAIEAVYKTTTKEVDDIPD